MINVKKMAIIGMSAMLAFATGCQALGPGAEKDPVNSATNVPGHTFPPAPTPVKTVIPGSASQDIPDETKIHHLIVDTSVSDKTAKILKIADLSVFGISNPAVEIKGSGLLFNFEDVGASAWCQSISFVKTNAMKTALSEFAEAEYLRIWVEAEETLSLNITPFFYSNSDKIYLTGKVAKLIDKFGNEQEFSTGNATDDAGEDSSVTVPDGFEGWISWELTGFKKWKTGEDYSPEKLTDFGLDIRPSSPLNDSFYILEDICFADKKVAGLYTMTSTIEIEGFNSMKDELAYKTNQLISATPEYEFCPEYDPIGYEGVKAIWLFGPEQNGKKTKVFAYLGVPEGANASAKVPAIILQHGGGGYAYPNWVKMWMDRGYAAIAIGNTGYYPATKNMTEVYQPSSWTHNLSKELNPDGIYRLPPDNDGMFKSESALENQWMYHAVCQTIIANNILRGLEAVDNTKIGITGISWGGVITSTAIGYDDRFAFAIPVYGSAFLSESHAWMKKNYNAPGSKDLWDPSNRINYVSTNIFWLCWSDDTCFSLNSNSKSYLHTIETSQLLAKIGMGHGHIEGWDQSEIQRYADSIVKGTEGLLKVTSEPEQKDGKVTCTFSAPKDAKTVSARLVYIDAPMSYSLNGPQSLANPSAYGSTETIDQVWQFADCNISGKNATVSLPSDAKMYYIEFTITTEDGGRYQTSTSLCDVK